MKERKPEGNPRDYWNGGEEGECKRRYDYICNQPNFNINSYCIGNNFNYIHFIKNIEKGKEGEKVV
ncbi:MAG TPA: hypothetical protein EYP86_01830 [Candidatus Altiarchaeales archaeon]|nr:hypothetical protein [Candidatus Altiarchaeales archaeon]